MQPIVRRTKKMARKSVLNTAKKAAQAEKIIPAEPAGHSTGRRDDAKKSWLITSREFNHPFLQPKIFLSQKIGCALL
jgi:hypothetical protein